MPWWYPLSKLGYSKPKGIKYRCWFAMATFAAVNIHLDAWIKHTNFSFVDTFMGVA